MPAFANWFRWQSHRHPDPCGVLDEVDTYYAAAFELVAIGAMHVEFAQRG